FSVPSEHAGNAALGASVTVSLQDRPEITTTGVVREVSPEADRVTGTYTVKVRLADPPREMRFGAVVVGRASVKGEAAIEIPSNALVQDGPQPQVWVVGVEGQVHKTPVTVLRYGQDSAFLAAGVNDGDRVVTAGVNALAEGQTVLLQKDAAP